MARKARAEFDGALYHVVERGDRQEIIFRDDADRRRFLETFREACDRTKWPLVTVFCRSQIIVLFLRREHVERAPFSYGPRRLSALSAAPRI
jgi:hypothetical protein